MYKRIIAAGLVLVLLIGGGYYAWRNRQAQQAAARAAGNLATAVAKKDTIEVNITGTANILSVDKRTIKSSVSGTVDKVLVEDGQPVKESQPIAILRNDDIRSAYEQSRVDLESARLRLESYKNPTAGDRSSAESRLAQATTALENRRKDVDKLRVTSPISGRVVSVKVNPGDNANAGQLLVTVADDNLVYALVQIPQSEISKVAVGQPASLAFGSELPGAEGVVDGISAEGTTVGKTVYVPVAVKFNNANRAYRTGLQVNANIKIKQDETVYGSGTVVPQVKYDMRAETASTVESVFVKDGDEIRQGQDLVRLTSQTVLAALQLAQSELEVAKENLARVKQGLLPSVSENEFKQQELRVKQAELTLEKRALDVDSLVIKSPINGTLVSHAINAGDTVTNNANCFVVADYSKMQMVIPVDELDITQLKIGQKASVTIEALPGRTFAAEVSKIATEGVIRDGIANYDVTLTLTDIKEVRGSMTGTATIRVARKEGALVVPAEAVRTTNNLKRVIVLKDGAQNPVNVRTGLTNGVQTEILQGINEGDVVVISNDRQSPRVMTPFGPGGGQQQAPQPARPGGR